MDLNFREFGQQELEVKLGSATNSKVFALNVSTKFCFIQKSTVKKNGKKLVRYFIKIKLNNNLTPQILINQTIFLVTIHFNCVFFCHKGSVYKFNIPPLNTT